jgi:signal transduction histidine kinase
VRAPSAQDRELIARAVHVAAIAIERRQLDDQLRALSSRDDAVREDERTNIAREIHDELGQALTALKLDLAWIGRRETDAALKTKLDEMTNATDEILASVRRISASLRPGVLDDLGLRAAIEWQAEEFERRTGIPCRVRSEVGDLQLERGLATAVFRIYQEALTNVARHASATAVDVSLRLERGQLKLLVEDDGVGVPEIAPRSSTLGLLGMRERARRCGGDCEVRRRSPRGTTVALSVPLRFPAERDHELGA